jgi:hypothetical protein
MQSAEPWCVCLCVCVAAPPPRLPAPSLPRTHPTAITQAQAQAIWELGQALLRAVPCLRNAMEVHRGVAGVVGPALDTLAHLASRPGLAPSLTVAAAGAVRVLGANKAHPQVRSFVCS